MRSHPVEKFGCTVCHQGQGRATDKFAHSSWQLEEHHGKQRWHYAGDHYWEDPMLPPGKLQAVIIDDLNDQLKVKLGKKKGTIQLDHGTIPTEDELFASLQTKLQEVLAQNKKAASHWRAVVRKLDGRVSLGLERRGGDGRAEPKPGAKSKPPRVEIEFSKAPLATLLGFQGTKRLKSKTKQLYTAPAPPVLPVRAADAAAQGSVIDTKSDYAFRAPRGAAGLQVPDAQRNYFIQALPEIESGCLRCHTGDANLVPRRSDSQAITAKLAYEKAESEHAKDPDAYRQVHGSDALPRVMKGSRDVESLAPTLDRGRQVFRQLNCTGCHLLSGFENNRNAGPQLNELSAKVKPAWLLTWLRDPRGWRAKTSMPNLWPAPLDPASKLPFPPGSPEYEKWDRERSQQTLAVAAYLFDKSDAPKAAGGATHTAVGGATRTALRDKIAGYANVEGATADDGKQLFEAYGCQGCHATVDAGSELPSAWRGRERDIAPTLSNLGAKTNADWIAYWIEDPSRYWHGTSMPQLRLTRKEAASIAQYLVGLTAKAPAAASVTKDEVARVTSAAKRNEMVACQVAGGQQMSLVDCGAKVIAYRGCYGCHQMEGFEGASLIGPELTGFAKKDITTLDFGYAIADHHLQTTETFVTLKLDAPRIYRRDRIELRMGDFDMSADEIRALVVFVKGMVPSRPAEAFDPMERRDHADAVAGRQLVEDLNCRACHVIEGRGGDIDGWRTAMLTRDAQLRAPWLDGEGARVQPEWLFSFLRDPKANGIRPWLHPDWVWGENVPPDKRALRMPSFNLSSKQWTSIVQYFATWDGEAYPYQVPKVAELSTQQKLFSLTHMNSPQAGNCMSCHYQGDFPVKRAKGDINKMAPNFAMVRRRLRPQWVEQWLLRPQNYLPYTKMTAFWATKDRPKSAAHWPKQSDPFISPPPKGWDKVPGFEKLSGPEQVRYVRDFLFSLDANIPFPKVGEEADSPHVDPAARLQAKDDDAGAAKPDAAGAAAAQPPRTGAVGLPARM
jgi:cytochrome c2